MNEHEWEPVEAVGNVKAKECNKCVTGAVSIFGGPWEYYRKGAYLGIQQPPCQRPGKE
jgi:hypothetical protein